jgi:hypothetical protein
MPPTKKTARVAGVFYLWMGLPAPFALLYLPAKLIVPGDAAATANNIVSNQGLFRLGIIAVLISSTGFVLLAVALYRLLNEVNKTQAALMVIFVILSVALGVIIEVSNLAALTLFRGPAFLSALDKPQRDALGMLFVSLHGQALTVNQIFWGLWLLPFGVLVMRSGFIPRILGVLLIVNGVAYVAMSITSLLVPEYERVVLVAAIPALLGELWILLWLLIKGVKEPLDRVAQ